MIGSDLMFDFQHPYHIFRDWNMFIGRGLQYPFQRVRNSSLRALKRCTVHLKMDNSILSRLDNVKYIPKITRNLI